MRLKEARAAGLIFYTGKVCKRHPELEGQRRASNGHCHVCIVERMRKHRKKNRAAINRDRRERHAATKAGTHTPRKYRRAGGVT
jgi:hypothetical protein